MRSQPYWRAQVKVFRNERLEWYAEPASEEFWARVWTERLQDGYYNRADQGDLQDIEDILLRHLTPEGKHLEAGCGLGYWVAALKARGYDIEGLEFSQQLVDLIHKTRPDLPIRQADATSIDRPANYYDSYLSFGVVEHRQAGPEPFLTEAFRVLKPGGMMIISVPYLSPIRQLKGRLKVYRDQRGPSDKFFQYAFSEKEFSKFLLDSGFQIEETHYQSVQRCLVEEIPVYFHLNRIRGARYLRKALTQVLSTQKAGHLILIVGRKGTENASR